MLVAQAPGLRLALAGQVGSLATLDQNIQYRFTRLGHHLVQRALRQERATRLVQHQGLDLILAHGSLQRPVGAQPPS